MCNTWTISDFADVANIIIAAVNLLLAGYIFIYQRQKDKDSKKDALTIEGRNIRLQWFKELIVQPHLSDINAFYRNVYSIEERFNVPFVGEEIKSTTSAFIKSERAVLRKSFDDLVRAVDVDLHNDVKKNLDDLIDTIITKIYDPGLNLNDSPTYEREITTAIKYSYNDLISRIYNYKGT